jgi:biopolymer transport protein ExbD
VKVGSRSEDEPEINLIPLIVVLFCLILFLVLTTSFNQRAALHLQLPQAQAGVLPDSRPPLILIVDVEGRYFIGNTEVPRKDVETLKGAIAQAAGSDRTQPVVLRADGRTPHQSVITAMDALGQLGFTKLSIATTPERKTR